MLLTLRYVYGQIESVMKILVARNTNKKRKKYGKQQILIVLNSCRSLLATAIPEYAATFMRSSEFYLQFTEGSIYKPADKGIP